MTILLCIALVGVVLIGIGVAVYLGRRNSPTSTGSLAATAVTGAESTGAPVAGSSTPGSTSADGFSAATSPIATTESDPSSPAATTAGPTAESASAGSPSSTAAADPTSGTGLAVTAPSKDTVVRLSETAAVNAHADAIRLLVQNNFDAINNRDYALFAATSSNAKDEATWRTEYASTRDSDIMIHQILVSDRGSTQIRMSFISQQSAELAPTDLAVGCIAWLVVYNIDDTEGTLTIGASAGPAGKKACA